MRALLRDTFTGGASLEGEAAAIEIARVLILARMKLEAKGGRR